jgi:hypothetical protein
MEKIAYWNASIDTKINLSDTFLSELKYKFISQKIKQANRESLLAAVEFDRNIYDIKQVFLNFKDILRQAENVNSQLTMQNKALLSELDAFKNDNEGIESISREDYLKKYKQEIADPYQIQIMELEMKVDKLTRSLTNKING